MVPRIHALEVGRLTGNKTVMRSEKWSSLLRRAEPYEFPIFSFVIEHPEGLIVIDTGINPRVRVPRPMRRLAPTPQAGPEDRIDARMRAAGFDPEEVRYVVATHLDWDHIGGAEHFPHERILVHRAELEFATSLKWRFRYAPKLWPSPFEPSLYDLDPEPYGPFPESRAVTQAGDVRLLPLPGHSGGQVGVVVEEGDLRLLFSADHVLSEDWFVEDCQAGRLLGLGFLPKQAAETTRRVHRFMTEHPTVLAPSHDADAPTRLAALKTTTVPPLPGG